MKDALGLVSAQDAVAGNVDALRAAAAAAGVNQVLVARAEGGAPTYQIYLTDIAIQFKGVKVESDPKIGTYIARNNYRR